MNVENENGKHDLNFFLDKQLQEKLHSADEHFLEREYISSNLAPYTVSNKLKSNLYNGNNSNATNRQPNNNSNPQTSSNNLTNSSIINTKKVLKYLHSVHVCGWCPNPTLNYRKSENDAPPRSRGGGGVSAARESLFSRDSKSRPQNINNFVFRHHSDPRKYIEQYRREHACYDTTNSTATKNEFLESRRFYAYNQYSPLAVGSHGASSQPNNYAPQLQPEVHPQTQSNEPPQQKSHNQVPTLHYSNRREQQRHTISANLRVKNQHQYKLAKMIGPKNENSYIQDYTEEYIEALEINNHKHRNSGSAKERSSPRINGTSMQKHGATKVNIPAGTSGTRGIRQLSSGISSDVTSVGQVQNQKSGSGSRTLDSLSCVVKAPSEKQSSQVHSGAEKDSSSSRLKSETVVLPRQNPSHFNSTTILHSTPATPAATAKDAQSSFNNVTASNSEAIVQNGNISNISNINGERKEDGPWLSKSAFQNGDYVDDIDSSSDSSAVSIGCLSTKCLGVEATVKPLPKLEPSCTYHVFPNELTLNQQQGYAPSLLWNPNKSALEKKLPPPNMAALEFGLPSPFRNNNNDNRVRPKTEEGKKNRVVEFITKEFVPDMKPISFCADVFNFKDTPRLAAAPGLKTNTIKPDLPPTFALQGFSKRPHFESFGKKRGHSKTAMMRKKKESKAGDKDGCRKSKSASTDASNSSPRGSSMKLKPVTSDPNNGSANSNAAVPSTLASVPYFKFWNSSLPPKSRERRRANWGEKSCELTMQQLAEMVLADESNQRDEDLKEAAKIVLEQHSRSEEEQQSAAGIATGDSWLAPSFHRISKTTLLESLRGVNQRPCKPAPRPLHLTFFREDSHLDVPHDPPQPGPARPDPSSDTRNLNGTTSTSGTRSRRKANDNNANGGDRKSKTVGEDGELEMSTSSPVTAYDEGGGKEAVSNSKRKKSLNKRWRGSSFDGHSPFTSSGCPQEVGGLSQSQIRSRSEDSINRERHSKSSPLHKRATDNSLSHRSKIKQLIDQYRMEKQIGRHVALLPDTALDASDIQSGLAQPALPDGDDASYDGDSFQEHSAENHCLKIKHFNSLTPGVKAGSGSSGTKADGSQSQPPENRSWKLKRELGDGEDFNLSKTEAFEKGGIEPSSSLWAVRDHAPKLQTSGPSIPPLYGTGLGNHSLVRLGHKKRPPKSKSDKLSPLLSDPKLETMTRHMSVKIRVSPMKYSKANHLGRSQTIHP